MEESDFYDEAEPMVVSNAPSSVPLPGEPEVEALTEASSSTSVVVTSPSGVHAAQSPDSDV